MNPRLKRAYDALPTPLQNAAVTLYSARLDRQRFGGRFREYRALMARLEAGEPEAVHTYQDARLRQIVRHAYDTVPYYRQLFDAHGLHPDSIRGRDDLVRIPLLTKDVIRHRGDELVSAAFARSQLAEGHTSGTTGTPLGVLYDSDMMAMTYAALDRQYRWAGVDYRRFGDRVAVIRGNIIVPLNRRHPPFWRINHLHRQLLLSNFHLSEANLPAYFQAIRDYGARSLDGYPSSVYVLAKVLLNRGETLPLDAVFTSSETLFDFQRQAIETAFECRVFDYYGSAERVVFAGECEAHQGHHPFPEYGITEIVDEEGNPVAEGEEGILVGTTLHNMGMPLIRYATNDRTAFKALKCPCGRPIPLLEDVTTKAEDLLKLKDGRLISPSVLTHPFKPLDAINGSQVVQTALDRLVVRIVPREDFGDAERRHLVTELKARLGEDMTVDIELVDELPRTAAGKFKWVVSDVDTGL